VNTAILTPTYWPEVRRGGERHAHDLARHTGARIVTGSPGPAGDGVVRLRRLPEERLVRRQFESHLGHLPALYAHLRRSDYHLVHALHHADASVAVRVGVPTVWTFLGVPHRRGLANKRLRLRLVRESMRADAVVALSHSAAQAFRTWLGIDPVVIHPASTSTRSRREANALSVSRSCARLPSPSRSSAPTSCSRRSARCAARSRTPG
jgi:hypothetical protein